MVDIHSHVLPCVDDGSISVEQSLEMLKDAIRDGVSDIVFTPHYRKGMFMKSVDDIKNAFSNFQECVKGLPISIHLGQEIAHDNTIFTAIKDGKLLTLNNTNYVLLEFRYTEYVDIVGAIFESKAHGLKPIIAHIERYEYVSVKDVEEFVSLGAIIQLNADSLVLKRGKSYKSFAQKLLSKGLVHVVANDMHYGREYCMKKAYDFVSKKYGNEVAEQVFVLNPKKILGI